MAEKKIGYSEPSSYIPKDIRKKYYVGEYFKQELGYIDSVWKRIVEFEGETFYTATGLPLFIKNSSVLKRNNNQYRFEPFCDYLY